MEKFVIKDMDIATGGPFVALLNHKDAIKFDLKHGDRILIRKGRREVVAVLDIAESRKAVPVGRIGLFEEILDSLRAVEGDKIELSFAKRPESIKHIRDKLKGKELNYRALYHIIDDITNDRLTDIEKTYFVSAGYTNGFTMQEVEYLTRAIVDTGTKLDFRKDLVLDKHCIGGVAGNRTTMVVVPIIASAGYTIPKTSSRAITSPAGTADTMEVLACVDMSAGKLTKVVDKVGASICWGGAINLAPADDKIIDIEHPLAIDAEGNLLASVMAKKASVSATHTLIDIPIGPRVKAKNEEEGKHLKYAFERLGRRLGIKTKVILTDGSQPIGNGIGPLLEAIDIMKILKNEEDAPKDLRDKVLYMSGVLLRMAGHKRPEKSAVELLESGEALKKMNQIIRAQGKNTLPKLGKYEFTVRSNKSGKIREINNTSIARIARIAGAPHDKGAGIFLHKHIGDRVKRGNPLFTIYAENDYELVYAKEILSSLEHYVIR